MLAGKTIVLGVTGGIAAYKAAEIVRWLRKEDAAVVVVMTAAAKQFITPLTLATLSGNPVLDDLWGPEQALTFGRARPDDRTSPIEHIEVADAADLVLIAPATAGMLARAAHGLADDLLSTILLATRAPIVFAPAMNVQMWANPIVQENVARLRAHGRRFIEPEAGELACGWEGRGRLASLEAIAAGVRAALGGKPAATTVPRRTGVLAGRHVVVTAGPTVEPLDPVRALTNHSSGKMGFALAAAARDAGARVTLVHGPVALVPPEGVEAVAVTTARSMGAALTKAARDADAVLMAAAVADWRPASAAAQKLKKGDAPTMTLTLVPNPDLLATLPRRPGMRVVGFAVETERELAGARKKLAAKKCDLLVLNNPTKPGSEFGGDTNQVTILDRQGGAERLPLMGKDQAAAHIVARLAALLGGTKAAGKGVKRGRA